VPVAEGAEKALLGRGLYAERQMLMHNRLDGGVTKRPFCGAVLITTQLLVFRVFYFVVEK
jgi:hypothetical protein